MKQKPDLAKKFKKWTAVGCVLAATTVIATVGTSEAASKPNIVVIWGDDIGQSNISAYTHGLMGYQTPNIGQAFKALKAVPHQ
jgi:hypothetical protein